MSSCSHSALQETACGNPGSELCGIQKTFSSTKVISRADKVCSNCEVKSDTAHPAEETPQSANTKVGEKAKLPEALSFPPIKSNSSFTFKPPPFTPSKTTKTQKEVEEKWKTLEDTIRWDALLTDTEKKEQRGYKVLISPTQFRFKLT